MIDIKNLFRQWLFVALAFALMMFVACSGDEEDITVVPVTDTTYTVAVVLPINDTGYGRFREVATWAMANISKAQEGMSRRIHIELEWYDEQAVDLDLLAQQLRRRDDVVGVIGALTSTHTDILANRLRGPRKTLITPSSTSATLVQSYAEYGFLWSLVETDITQCEALLTRARSMGAHSVSLLASKSIYGQTFTDWFAFQAHELGLRVGGVFNYDEGATQNQLRSTLSSAFSQEHDMMICVPDNMEEVRTVLEAKHDCGESAPSLLFSDGAYVPALLDMGSLSEYVEGLAPCADPEQGFDVAYRVHFGEDPKAEDAQFYDAIVLIALGLTALEAGIAPTLNEAISQVVQTKTASGTARPFQCVWTDVGLRNSIAAIRLGQPLYDIAGASSGLDFDATIGTSIVRSVYSHWMVYNHRFIALTHITSDGSHRTESTLAAWNWVPSVVQDFDAAASFHYPPHTGNWALLVAASKGWDNYRHQADVLNMYQILKYFGYDDDHIVLIQADDLAQHPENKTPGQVQRYDGQNLYVDVHTDYLLESIQADDLIPILTGQSSERLPHVIKAGPTDNVLVFWSGHGEPGSYLLGDRSVEDGFTVARMDSLLRAIQSPRCYRKMLWLVEACYGASVAIAAEADHVPGVMFMTAAGALETSKADVRIDGVFRTNRFTEILTSILREAPNTSFRDLYYTLSHQTIGSHVTVLNAGAFDNLFKTNIQEFVVPVDGQ